MKVTLYLRNRNIGLVGQWLTCHVHPTLYPEALDEGEMVHEGHVVILEDDMQASPLFWRYLFACLGRSVAGAGACVANLRARHGSI